MFNLVAERFSIKIIIPKIDLIMNIRRHVLIDKDTR